MKRRHRSEHQARASIKSAAEARAEVRTEHYEYTKIGVRELANTELSRDVYDGWVRAIRSKWVETYLEAGPTRRTTIHRVEYNGVGLTAVYDRKIHAVLTVGGFK